MNTIIEIIKKLPKEVLLYVILDLMQEGKITFHEISEMHIEHLEQLKKAESDAFRELQKKVMTLWCGYKKNTKKNLKDIMRYLHDKGTINITLDEIDKY